MPFFFLGLYALGVIGLFFWLDFLFDLSGAKLAIFPFGQERFHAGKIFSAGVSILENAKSFLPKSFSEAPR